MVDGWGSGGTGAAVERRRGGRTVAGTGLWQRGTPGGGVTEIGELSVGYGVRLWGGGDEGQ